MKDLSLKDKKLLYVLNENCRLSNTKIGKLVGLSKDGIKYKIERFHEKNIILNNFVNLNYDDLGYIDYVMLFRLQKVDAAKQEKIAELISKKKYVMYCATCFGTWDLWIELAAKSIVNFEEYVEDMIKIIGNKLVDYQTFISIKQYQQYSYTIPEFFEKVNVKYKYNHPKEYKSTKLDELDKKMIVILSKDARTPLHIIANKCKRSLDVVRYRLKRIEDSGLINSYQILMNNQKLGYSMNAVFLKVRNLNPENEKKLGVFFKENKCIRWAFRTLGQQMIIVETLTKSTEDFQELITDLKNQFSDVITSYESVLEFKKYKDIMLPNLDELD